MKILRRLRNAWAEGGWPLLRQKIWRRIRIDHRAIFAHQLPHGLPAVQLETKYLTPTTADIEIARRILAAFNRASADADQHTPAISADDRDAWDEIQNDQHNEFLNILNSQNAERAAAYLANMHAQRMTYGISGTYEYNWLSSGRLRRQEGAIVKDILVSLAEALGILPYEAIVPYVAKKNIYQDADLLVGEIEQKIGISIVPPDIDGGLTKLKLRTGSFDNRDLWSLYAAWRISQLIPKGAAVAEIGAGLGKAALYANRFNFPNYSIFDLPFMNVLQAWYLIKGLPMQKIILYGEATGKNEEDAIKIMPSWEFARSDQKYSLVLNQDSFPEIKEAVVIDYLNKIRKCSRTFLSINQEHQAPLFPGASKRNLVVSRVIEAVGGFRRQYRFPFWLRKGYVSEFYICA